MQATRITALGGVLLAAAIVMIQVRLEDSWAHGTQLVMLAGATAGIGYAIWTRERGPAWVGGTALVFALVTVAVPDDSGGSLVGWPLAFLILATATLVVGMAHPRRT
jgi:hypothetical protein